MKRPGSVPCVLLAIVSLLPATCLQGCVLVGGSSRGGFFIWPGGLGLAVIVLLILLLRRR